MYRAHPALRALPFGLLLVTLGAQAQPTAWPAQATPGQAQVPPGQAPAYQAPAAAAPNAAVMAPFQPHMACEPPRQTCPGATPGMCYDLANDPAHCGACGNACGTGQRCVSGACVDGGSDGYRLYLIPALELGWGSMFVGDNHVYTGGVDISNASMNGSYLPFPTRDGAPFDGGFRIAGSLALGIGASFQIWLRAGYQSYSGDARQWAEAGLTPVDSLTVEDLDFAVGPRWSLMPQHGTFPLNITVGPYFGYRGFRRTTTRGGLDNTYNVDNLAIGARIGLDVRVFRGLAVGAYVAAEASLPVGGGWTYDGVQSMNLEPEPYLTIGGSVSYAFGFIPRVEEVAEVPPSPAHVYVLVTSALDAAVTEREGAEVTETASYRERRGRYDTVAVVAPDRCADQSLSEATGQGGSGGEVLATQCGVEMGEIERALTLMGFRVISWRTMRRAQGLPRDSARQLGAQVLFQVNSLERSTNMVGVMQAERLRAYHFSNPMGVEGPPAPMPDPDADVLDSLIAAQEEQMASGDRPGAGLDINAVDVATGQTIWLYRWRRLLRGEGAARAEVLVRGTPRPAGPLQPQFAWQPTAPVRPAQPAAAPQVGVRVGSRSRSTQRTGYEDRLRTQLFQLLREIISDSVHRFRCGTEGDAAIPECRRAPR